MPENPPLHSPDAAASSSNEQVVTITDSVSSSNAAPAADRSNASSSSSTGPSSTAMDDTQTTNKFDGVGSVRIKILQGGVPHPETFDLQNLGWSTSILEVKQRLRQTLASRPSVESQHVIYLGRRIQNASTLAEVIRRNAASVCGLFLC
jgi:hypothetical protein